MKKLVSLLAAWLVFSGIIYATDIESLSSPNGNLVFRLVTTPGNGLAYLVDYKGKPVVKESAIGFKLNAPAVVLDKFTVSGIEKKSIDESWDPVWGEVKTIRNHCNEITLKLTSANNIVIILVARVFDEGVGFRFEFPEQPNLKHFIIGEENTQIALTGDHQVWWIPGDFDTNEYWYNHTKLSEIDAAGGKLSSEIHAKTFFDRNAVQTPLMMKSADGLYINLHEAALSNYPAMNLVLNKENFTFTSHLVPDAVGNMAYLQTPAKTPWRTIIVSDKAAEVLASRMILNLNEPSKVANTSWIKPQKFVGVWWEMHVGVSSWDYSGGQVGSQQATKVPHGANTANVKRYIDFAAKNNIQSVLVEGWNTGWEDWFGQWKEDVFDFVTPYPDFDIAELSAYAKSKGVKIIMHHETSGSVTNYERWMDTAYRLMKQYGYDAVKTGYVGRIIPRGEHHDGQWMVRHYERVAAKTASYGIMADMHESVRLTGMHRTYPNWIASEAARGNEFNAWSVGNPPDHETILPFTRLMGGPMDYTPGIFKIKMSSYNPEKKEQVHTTLAKQLALYITLYSPLQMAADLPENYEARPDAFQFIKDVAVDWDDTRILEAEPGDYLTIARKGKNSASWFIGAITDENARQSSIKLDFLDANTKYLATVYHDGANAHWQNNPEDYAIDKIIVDAKSALALKLAPGGGTAVSLIPATPEQVKEFGTKKKTRKK